MRRFSVRPTLTLQGREFKGVRGWPGKPTHPPLTDFRVAAYVMAAVFDVISTIGRHETFAGDFFRAGTYVMIVGAAVSLVAALTGFWDWLHSREKGTRARRTANAYAWTTVIVTALAAVDIALRLNVYDTRTHPTVVILVLSIAVAALVSLGAAFGATPVYDYGFNVEAAGDGPVWHMSEDDVLPRGRGD